MTLHRYNSRFFKAPIGVDSSDGYSSPGYVSSLSLPADDHSKWEKDGEVVLEKNDEGHFVAFVPEYENDGRDDGRCFLEVEYEDGNSYTIDFKYYKDPPLGSALGDSFDLRRNYWYQFELNRSIPEVSIDINVDVQPFTEHKVRFDFGLKRDDRGDLMVLPVPKTDEMGNVILDENGDMLMTYPKYFLDFIADKNPNHKYPEEMDAMGNPLEDGAMVKLEDGDYYAIVVGEDGAMSSAVVWVKDRTGCRVLSNFTSTVDTECSARLVQEFYGNNQSEIYHKDIFGFRRVHHFVNHNSIVIHPTENMMLFRKIENFGKENQKEYYYEVESWDDGTLTGWIINKDKSGEVVGFQEITSDGNLGKSVDIDGKSIVGN